MDNDQYKVASINDVSEEDIVKWENTIKAKTNKDVILIAYERKK